jgi:hypothetical protein
LALTAAAVTAAPGCGDDTAPGADGGVPIVDSGGVVIDAPPDTPDADTRDIRDRIAAIPGVADLMEKPLQNLPGYRFFTFTFEQPADHDAPAGQKFKQRVTLLHRDTSAPTVLFSSGYYVSTQGRRSELTRFLNGNQLSVEHRFFEPSRPDPADWSLLTIEQAAADFHRLRGAFGGIYGGKWLGTGASKGGMTALFHRRFYPQDLDVTVSYVAPISTAGPDPRYASFIAKGDEPACRQALFAWQQAILGQKNEVLDLVAADATSQGWTFAVLGVERAFEHAVIELPFYFWQYSDASLCPMVPAAGATAQQNYAFLNDVSAMSNVADDQVYAYAPYFFQSGVQFGYPQFKEDHILTLLAFPQSDVPKNYVPYPVDMTYDPKAMQDVLGWLSSQGERLIFIYGENDPWSAGMVDLGGAKDSYLFVQPDGNHGSRITDLAPADRDAAIAALERWTGVDIATPMKPGRGGEVPGGPGWPIELLAEDEQLKLR